MAKKLTKTQISKVLTGIAAGKSTKLLASRFKVTPGTISYWRGKFNAGTAYVAADGTLVGVGPTGTVAPVAGVITGIAGVAPAATV